jgi:hypothetical protein
MVKIQKINLLMAAITNYCNLVHQNLYPMINREVIKTAIILHTTK